MRTERSTAQACIARYTRLNYRPQKLAFHKPILRLWRATAPNRFRKMLIPVQAPAEKTSGPVAQHGYVARSNAKEHTTDNRGVVNPDDVQSTEFKSLRAHHQAHPTTSHPSQQTPAPTTDQDEDQTQEHHPASISPELFQC